MWDELLFLFNYGSIKGNYCYFGGYCFGVVWGIFFFFCKHSSNKLFLEDLVALGRAYKNYQLLLIC